MSTDSGKATINTDSKTIFAEIFAFLGYLVYLEILELRFCGLDQDLKRKIIARTANETNKTLNEMQIISDDNSQNSKGMDDSFVSNEDYIF